MNRGEIKIINNVLDEELFNEFSTFVVHNSNFVFGITPTACLEDSYMSFSAGIPFDNDYQNDLFNRVLKQITDKAEMKVEEQWSRRVGVIHRDIEYTVNVPHVDYDQPHITAVMYLNDSDGDTYMYDKLYEHGDEPNLLGDHPLVLTTIPPEKNKVVIFDGLRYHSSSTPTKNQLRYAVNFNFSIEE